MRASIVLLFLLAGCLEMPIAQPPASCMGEGAETHIDAGHVGGGRTGHQTDPRQAWDHLSRYETNATMREFDMTAPSGWETEVTLLPSPDPVSGLVLRRLVPEASPDGGDVSTSYYFEEAGQFCNRTNEGGTGGRLATPVEGALAKPGSAVDVWTAGFWENGTLFYTNIPEVDSDPDLPRAGWYTYENGDPLAVYVYDEDRTERPAQWSACVPAGSPTTACAWNYSTTIAGFNEALKGLSTSTSRVVHMPPEKAYTRPGAETHPLYGDAIVFYILIANVQDVPCPTTLVRCDLPDL